ncbi:MAG: hypothetical protein GQ573_04050 [Gammaproteobacteria bacterium]|nr:hypothetical protein [Gammaproteobacteria bacterium]
MKATSLKVASRNYAIIFIASLAFVMFSSQVNATCSRDDITFYLDKGFTTDQITALCSEAVTPASAPNGDEPHSKPQDTEQHSASAAVDDNTLLLQRAVKAQEIKLSSESLQYTQKICIEYGEEDLFGFTPKVCPDVKFIIALKDLEVTDTGKKFGFYGTQEIRVKGLIKREIIGNLEDNKPEERELILEKFEKGDETAIPIRDDFSLEEVKQVLLDLSI